MVEDKGSIICSVMSQDTWTQTDTRSTGRSDILRLIDETEESLFSTGKFGRFGGIFVPETLVTCLNKLVAEFNLVLRDPEFQVHSFLSLFFMKTSIENR